MAWPHLPKRVHYALKGLCCLASAQGPVRARELARCVRIPPAQAAKILYLLTWKGFVSSRRGSNGGFWLRVPPERIRVRDVMNFFLPPTERAREQSRDPILALWHETTGTTTRQTFEHLSLADLVKNGRAARAFKCLTGDEGNWRFFA